jgi:hypothetical protein
MRMRAKSGWIRTHRTFFLLVFLLAAGAISDERAHGQLDDAAAMRDRIQQLEAENAQLRNLLNEIKSLVTTIPSGEKEPNATSTRFRIFVEPGEWGSSSVADVKKVCESAAMMFTPHLKSGVAAPMLLQNDGTGPITLFRRGGNNEHIVRLDTKNRAWAQLAFQFSHELCHVMCNYRDVPNQQLWFEETLCEVASLFALKKMGEEWKKNPPYSNWKSYSGALRDYAAQRLKTKDTDGFTLEEIYRANLSELRATATNRDINNQLASKLLPMFEETPAAWEAVRYLNRGPAEENETFEGYLHGWYQRVPDAQKHVVKKISAGFGITF